MSQIIESSLPMVIQKQEQETAINYKVFGTADGAGVETGNAFNDSSIIIGKSISSSAGSIIDDSASGYTENYSLTNSGRIYIKFFGDYSILSTIGIVYYDASYNFVTRVNRSGSNITQILNIGNSDSLPYCRITAALNEGVMTEQAMRSLKIVMYYTTEDEPLSYIPPGYQIPLTLTSGETENEFDSEIEQGNMLSGVDQPSTSANYYKRCRTVGFINVENGVTYTLKSSYNMWWYPYKNGVYYSSQGADQWGTTFTFTPNSNYNQIRIMFANLDTTETLNVSDFINDVMLVKGSTAPDHYVPHRYVDACPLYIGSTKLGAEEYLDYAEQKVYKRTGNDFPFAKKGTFAFGNDGSIISDGKGKLVISIPSTIPSGTKSELIPLDRAYTIPQSVDTGGEFIFYIGNNVDKFRLLLCFYDADGVQIESWSCSPAWRISTAYSQMTGKTIAYIGVRAGGSGASGNIELTPMFSKNADLTSYISYLQPTDPPAPLPSITSYIGENTFNSTEVINKMRIEFNEGFIYDGKDISQFHINNQFYDLIDSSFYSLIADNFNSLTSYSEGDFCIYNYQLYKCLFATQGDWISECWELISLADLIQGDGQEVGVDDDTWRIIYEISNGTLSDNLVIDYDSIKGGKFAYCDMSTAELPNCSQISPFTFYSCKNLSFVSAPNCTSIGTAGLSACDALISYNMPLVSIIGTEAFRACIALPLASFSQNLQIGSRAFLGCTSLSEVNMPAVSIIYSDAFSGCTALTTLELPGCLSIYSYALRNCTQLETVSFSNLVRIYSSGFAGCAKLMSLYLLSTKMCTLQNANAFGGTPISVSTGGIYGSIYVPSTLVESYKVATGWVTYANRFVAYQE